MIARYKFAVHLLYRKFSRFLNTFAVNDGFFGVKNPTFQLCGRWGFVTLFLRRDTFRFFLLHQYDQHEHREADGVGF